SDLTGYVFFPKYHLACSAAAEEHRPATNRPATKGTPHHFVCNAAVISEVYNAPHGSTPDRAHSRRDARRHHPQAEWTAYARHPVRLPNGVTRSEFEEHDYRFFAGSLHGFRRTGRGSKPLGAHPASWRSFRAGGHVGEGARNPGDDQGKYRAAAVPYCH